MCVTATPDQHHRKTKYTYTDQRHAHTSTKIKYQHQDKKNIHLHPPAILTHQKEGKTKKNTLHKKKKKNIGRIPTHL